MRTTFSRHRSHGSLPPFRCQRAPTPLRRASCPRACARVALRWQSMPHPLQAGQASSGVDQRGAGRAPEKKVQKTEPTERAASFYFGNPALGARSFASRPAWLSTPPLSCGPPGAARPAGYVDTTTILGRPEGRAGRALPLSGRRAVAPPPPARGPTLWNAAPAASPSARGRRALWPQTRGQVKIR